MLDKKNIYVLVLCLALVVVCRVVHAGQEDDSMIVEGNRVYLVKPGDSLSGIAAALLGDPARWKEIHTANPQIKNPSLIFPGDALVIGETPVEHVGEMETETGLRARKTGEGIPGEKIVPPAVLKAQDLKKLLEEKSPQKVDYRPVAISAVPVVSVPVYEMAGYISADVPTSAIIGSPDKRLACSKHDVVFINRGDEYGLTVGQEFRITRPVKEIYHPETGNYLGWLIKILGRLKVECIRQNTATARITDSSDYITIGDRIEPYIPGTPPEQDLAPKLAGPCLPKTAGNKALILAVKDDKEIISEGDVVYIDKGMVNDVNPGSRFAVYRDKLLGENQEAFLVGEIQVLLSQNNTSTALVTNSIYPISSDDGLVTW